MAALGRSIPHTPERVEKKYSIIRRHPGQLRTVANQRCLKQPLAALTAYVFRKHLK